MISVAAALPDYKELRMLSLQMDVFIGRHFETNQKGVGKQEHGWKENKTSPQTNKTLQITTGQEKNQVVISPYWISKNNSGLIGIPEVFSFVFPLDNYKNI